MPEATRLVFQLGTKILNLFEVLDEIRKRHCLKAGILFQDRFVHVGVFIGLIRQVLDLNGAIQYFLASLLLHEYIEVLIEQLELHEVHWLEALSEKLVLVCEQMTLVVLFVIVVYFKDSVVVQADVNVELHLEPFSLGATAATFAHFCIRKMYIIIIIKFLIENRQYYYQSYNK